MNNGKLYLLPTSLGTDEWKIIIPEEVAEITIQTRYFAVENIKTARRYLRKLDREFPIDDSTFFILNKNTPHQDLSEMLVPIKNGFNVGVMSEAGCPGIADPGADLVALAHQQGVEVFPLTGPSSILLGLIGSGFNGQSFCFHGYLPKDRKQRIEMIRKMESTVNRSGQTQIFMDTPFRNNHLFEDLLGECKNDSFLCVACDLTLPTQDIRTKRIQDWKKVKLNLDKRPTMFLLGKPFVG